MIQIILFVHQKMLFIKEKQNPTLFGGHVITCILFDLIEERKNLISILLGICFYGWFPDVSYMDMFLHIAQKIFFPLSVK